MNLISKQPEYNLIQSHLPQDRGEELFYPINLGKKGIPLNFVLSQPQEKYNILLFQDKKINHLSSFYKLIEQLEISDNFSKDDIDTKTCIEAILEYNLSRRKVKMLFTLIKSANLEIKYLTSTTTLSLSGIPLNLPYILSIKRKNHKNEISLVPHEKKGISYKYLPLYGDRFIPPSFGQESFNEESAFKEIQFALEQIGVLDIKKISSKSKKNNPSYHTLNSQSGKKIGTLLFFLRDSKLDGLIIGDSDTFDIIEGGQKKVRKGFSFFDGKEFAFLTNKPEQENLRENQLALIYETALLEANKIAEDTVTPYLYRAIIGDSAIAIAKKMKMDLLTYINDTDRSVEENMLIALNLTKKCIAIERAGIVHRDIKPENILLTCSEDTTIDFRICDFALADRPGIISEPRGTLPFMAYEYHMKMLNSNMHAHTKTDSKEDVWSLGVTFFTLFYGEEYLDNKMLQDILSKKNGVLEYINILKKAEKSLADFLQEEPHYAFLRKMLERNAKNRASFEEIEKDITEALKIIKNS